MLVERSGVFNLAAHTRLFMMPVSEIRDFE
jgi:hypothetical protein